MAKQLTLFSADKDMSGAIAARAAAVAASKGRTADQKFYRFEDAVGHAGPYRFIGVLEFPSKALAEANPFAYQNALRELGQQQRALGVSGGSCEVCGHVLMSNFVLQAADGHNFVVGCECIHKAGEMTSEIKEAKKRSDRARNAANERIRQDKARKAFLAKIGAVDFVSLSTLERSAWALNDKIEAEKRAEMRRKAAAANEWLIDVLKTGWGGFCSDMVRELKSRYLDLDNFTHRQVIAMADVYAKQSTGRARRNSKAYHAGVKEFSAKSGLPIALDGNYPCFHYPTTFVTSDGYTLTWDEDRAIWTDGDLDFDCDDDGYPIDSLGARLSGKVGD